MEPNRLLSHEVTPESLEKTLQMVTQRIKAEGDKSYITIQDQLELLNQLKDFDFGRYLLQNQGLNGYWTHYMLTHPWHGRITGKNNRGNTMPPLERFILDKSPVFVATQQRFALFLRENQTQVKNNAKLASIPCGMLGELLYLDYSGINNIELFGIDYDQNALLDAEILAKDRNLTRFLKLMQQDAWNLNFDNEFDLISSNGLNIYEPADDKVTELYQQFYQALKPNGKLVTSFLTFPPSPNEPCEWDLTKVNRDDLLLQKIIVFDIIAAKFQCYRSTEKTRTQLETVGFKDIQFIYDEAKIFPTITAFK